MNNKKKTKLVHTFMDWHYERWCSEVLAWGHGSLWLAGVFIPLQEEGIPTVILKVWKGPTVISLIIHSHDI